MNMSTAIELVHNGRQHAALTKTMDLNQMGISLICAYHMHTHSINIQYITYITCNCKTSVDGDQSYASKENKNPHPTA